MPTLIGLYADSKKAEETVNQLSTAEIDDIEFETIENWHDDIDTEVEAVPALNSGNGTGAIPAVVAFTPAWDLGDEETQYFKRAVKDGGVLIAVHVPDEEQVPKVSRILEHHSQKVATSS